MIAMYLKTGFKSEVKEDRKLTNTYFDCNIKFTLNGSDKHTVKAV
jgi:hypothetical protein